MPIKRPQLVNNEFYHVIKRGVEERKIFLDNEDRLRFINSLLVFNDKKPAPWQNRDFWKQGWPRELFSWQKNYVPDSPLIEIHAFSLMDNHFHLLLRQLSNNGITDFMRKLGGYAYYFNKKYKRVGPLFQGRFKAVLIKNEEQLKNTFVYIHTNPIGLIIPDWKEKGIKSYQEAKQFLKKYKWSSHLDYLGEENFPRVIKKEFFFNLLGDVDNYQKEIDSWISFKVDFNRVKNIFFE